MTTKSMITAESVTEGHPDKLCDQISDAIVDHVLLQDRCARIRAEAAVSSAIVFIATRFSTSAVVDFSQVARKVIEDVGYTDKEFNAKSCSILASTQERPPDKWHMFNEHELSEKEINKITAVNQVTVFGFACDQADTYMPLPITLSHKLARRLTEVHRSRELPYVMPDGKVQVGVEYDGREPVRIHSVTITASQKKAKDPTQKQLQKDIIKQVVDPVFDGQKIKPDKDTRMFINPTGCVSGRPGPPLGSHGPQERH